MAFRVTSWHTKLSKHVSLKPIEKTTSDVPITIDNGEPVQKVVLEDLTILEAKYLADKDRIS